MYKLSVLLIITVSLHSTLSASVPDQKYREMVQECNADPKTAYKMDFKKPPPTEYSPQLGAHSLCIAKKVGSMTEEGQVVVEHLRQTFRRFTNDEAKIDNTIVDCLRPQPTPQETAFHLFICSAEFMKLPKKPVEDSQ